MKISEAAAATGLDVSSIRFYERKGLVEPPRAAESKYRDYTDADILRLKTIILYRKMGLSIEAIRGLLDEKNALADVLSEQREQLLTERTKLDASLDLCDKILADGAAAPLDLDRYLAYVKEEEARGRQFPGAVQALDSIAAGSSLRLTQFFGFPLARFILTRKWLRRAAALFVVLVLVVFPAALLLSELYAIVRGKPVSAKNLFFVIVFFALCLANFRRIVGMTR